MVLISRAGILYERLILVDQVDALISPFTIAIPAFAQAMKYGVRPLRSRLFSGSLIAASLRFPSLTSATLRASPSSTPHLTCLHNRYYATKGAPNGTFGGGFFSAVPNTLSYISQCFDTMCVTNHRAGSR